MYRYAGLVDMGVYEDHNDDRAMLDGKVLGEGALDGSTDSNSFHAAVFDGVGGALQGARAAQLAAEGMAALDADSAGAQDIKDMIEQVNTALIDIQKEENIQGELLTTAAGICAQGEELMVYNAGDSRVYRQRGRFIRQLSKDHSHVQMLVDMGKITPEEAKGHPQRNVIIKCLGYDPRVNPRVVEFDDLLAGDLIMICSDGISDVLDDKEIAEILSQHGDLTEGCTALRDAAAAKGSLDNMTVLLVRKEGA